ADGVPVILLHGLSYEPRGYDEMAPLSAASLEENKESAASPPADAPESSRTQSRPAFAALKISIVRDEPPSSPFPRFPCMGLVKEFRQGGASFFFHRFLCSI